MCQEVPGKSGWDVAASAPAAGGADATISPYTGRPFTARYLCAPHRSPQSNRARALPARERLAQDAAAAAGCR